MKEEYWNKILQDLESGKYNSEIEKMYKELEKTASIVQENLYSWLDLLADTGEVLCSEDIGYEGKDKEYKVKEQPLSQNCFGTLCEYLIQVLNTHHYTHEEMFGPAANFSYKDKVFQVSRMVGQGTVYHLGVDTNPKYFAPKIIKVINCVEKEDKKINKNF